MEREGERAEGSAPRFVIRDRDSKVMRAFDGVFMADSAEIITTRIQAPNANAFAKRWVRTVRQECLDWMLIWGRRHLERVLDEYLRHDYHERPHRSLELRPPDCRRRVGPWCCHGRRQRPATVPPRWLGSRVLPGRSMTSAFLNPDYGLCRIFHTMLAATR
jgi:transposase InsO family protein